MESPLKNQPNDPASFGMLIKQQWWLEIHNQQDNQAAHELLAKGAPTVPIKGFQNYGRQIKIGKHVMIHSQKINI